MRHVYKFLFFVILLFCYFITAAQSNFRPGYIITNTNDSIVGLIDFRTDIANSQVCRFKPTEKAVEELYYPGEIKKYRFINDGKYYVSHSININNQIHQVFLEYLVSGMMNLYYYKDPNFEQDYYFFEEENGNMISITKKNNEIIEMKLKTDQRYLETLNYLFKDYPTILKDVNSNSFNKGSMVKITKEYHALTCTTEEKCIDFENDYKRQYVTFKFSVYGSMQILNYTFRERELADFGSVNSLFPTIGGQFSISNPRWFKSLSLMVDVSFSGIKGERDHIDGQSVIYQKYKFDALTIIQRLNVIYKHPSGKIRPTVEGGLSRYFLFNRSSSLYLENTTPYTITSKLRTDYLLPFSSFWGGNCGVGFDYFIGNDRFLFCQLSIEQVRNINIIKSGQLKFGFTF